ncbi:unnamed protein product [Kluyveromyces dobzhanskii CBS 2104]|uniref:WGS project CCBQ000000000 data, contig 00015 n=1 Tax=Kluyveromyces dobzhanskii CBS 2104 TaxID=1427455 RepID=A0A0A8LCT5_9SACH|nr:unnamed protein product [Kluyveromyces dobzhanskii CBS 2104]
MFDISFEEGFLKQRLEELAEDPRASLSLQLNCISFELISQLYEEFWKNDDNVSMKQLLKSGKLRFKAKKVPGEGYSESFMAELNRLKAVQQEKEYQEMLQRDSLHVAGPLADRAPSIAEMNKEVKEQISAVVNVLLTVFGTIYAVWYVTRTGWDIHFRVLLCLFSGILVLIADVAMYNVYNRKVEEARVTEKRKKVVNKVAKRLV